MAFFRPLIASNCCGGNAEAEHDSGAAARRANDLFIEEGAIVSLNTLSARPSLPQVSGRIAFGQPRKRMAEEQQIGPAWVGVEVLREII